MGQHPVEYKKVVLISPSPVRLELNGKICHATIFFITYGVEVLRLCEESSNYFYSITGGSF